MRRRLSFERAVKWRRRIAPHAPAASPRIRRPAGLPNKLYRDAALRLRPATSCGRDNESKANLTRQRVPSRILRNCMETKKAGPLYSTVKRGGWPRYPWNQCSSPQSFWGRVFFALQTRRITQLTLLSLRSSVGTATRVPYLFTVRKESRK
jgi:hypothetical protein